MSATPQDVQDQIAQAQALLLKTTASGSGMLKKYGQPTAWPPGTFWAQAWAQLAGAFSDAGQLVAPTTPPSPPSPGTGPSGLAIPAVPSGWTEIFRDDFTTDVPLGSWLSGSNSAPAPSGIPWGAYPYPWPDTYRNGYRSPEKCLSIHGSVLDVYLHAVNGVPYSAVALPHIGGPTSKLWIRRAMLLPQIVGFYVATLLWPDSGVWPRDGEIDFPEGALDGSAFSSFLHHMGATSGGDQSQVSLPVGADGSWHLFDEIWQGGTSWECRVDGVSIATLTTRVPTGPMHYCHQFETVSGGSKAYGAGHVLMDWCQFLA